jgi:hypothetical protein
VLAADMFEVRKRMHIDLDKRRGNSKYYWVGISEVQEAATKKLGLSSVR